MRKKNICILYITKKYAIKIHKRMPNIHNFSVYLQKKNMHKHLRLRFKAEMNIHIYVV